MNKIALAIVCLGFGAMSVICGKSDMQNNIGFVFLLFCSFSFGWLLFTP